MAKVQKDNLTQYNAQSSVTFKTSTFIYTGTVKHFRFLTYNNSIFMRELCSVHCIFPDSLQIQNSRRVPEYFYLEKSWSGWIIIQRVNGVHKQPIAGWRFGGGRLHFAMLRIYSAIATHTTAYGSFLPWKLGFWGKTGILTGFRELRGMGGTGSSLRYTRSK